MGITFYHKNRLCALPTKGCSLYRKGLGPAVRKEVLGPTRKHAQLVPKLNVFVRPSHPTPLPSSYPISTFQPILQSSARMTPPSESLLYSHLPEGISPESPLPSASSFPQHLFLLVFLSRSTLSHLRQGNSSRLL